MSKIPHKFLLSLVFFQCLASLSGAALAQSEPEKLVIAAEKTFDNFVRDPDMTWIQQNLAKARAVLIAPAVVKAGFIFGGSGGRAVLLATDPKTGKWHGPAFYTLATASVGFQAGIELSEVVMLVMTDRGLNSLLGGTFKLGGDVGIAAGPVGAGAKSSITSDFVSFNRSKGIYGGLNFDGSSVSLNDDWNQSYYKQSATSTDILVRYSAVNGHSAKLLEALAAAANRK